MAPIRKAPKPGRNEACPCGSGMKFKRCHGFDAGRSPMPAAPAVTYIDSGEEAVRWVICDAKGTSFFSDKDNRIIVFQDKAVALAIAGLEEFAGQEYGEINVAGVGPTKFAHLCEILPYVEVSDVEIAAAMIRERIASQLNQEEGTATNGDETQAQEEGQQSSHEDGAQEAPVGEAEAGAGDQAAQ